MSSGKRRTFCLGLDINTIVTDQYDGLVGEPATKWLSHVVHVYRHIDCHVCKNEVEDDYYMLWLSEQFCKHMEIPPSEISQRKTASS